MKTKNNISKPLQDEQKVKEAIKVAMSETPEEEFNLDVLSELLTRTGKRITPESRLMIS